jgi:flagellar motor switch protein FliM
VDGILSQDEVDALLDGGSSGDQDSTPAPDNGGVRAYNIASQERIVRGRMPTLEIIHERFARNFRIGMFNFMRRTPEISIGTIRVLKYNAFLREMILPSNLNLVALKPLRGTCLFIFEPTLVFAVIDCMFGGNGKFHARIEGREFTATELRIIQRMLDMALKEYMNAWAPTYKLGLEYVRSEMQPQFANIATPSEVVVAVKFDIDLGDAGGGIHICIPYSSVEPIRDLLFSSTQTDTGELDSRWLGLLSREMQAAELELVATLAHAQATLKQVLAMRPGDVIALEPPEQIQLAVHGVPIIEGRVGMLRNRYAVQVDRILTSRDEESGDKHAV